MRPLHRVLLAASVALGLSAPMADATVLSPYFQTNLVSDIAGLAPVTDLNLQNPWGVSESAASPLWISDQHAGVATLYTVHGLSATPAGGPPPLVVTIPATASGPQGPTGQVNNSNMSAFLVNGASARFIFANLNGTISAWNGVGTTAIPQATTPGAVYTGLAIGGTTSAPLLYAANGAQNRIDVFNGFFAPITIAGGFPNPFPGLVPFNVQNIGGQIYVTYALPGRAAQITAGPGNGAVAIFDLNGNFVRTVINGSQLASPWGITLAPIGFGPFGGDLLVGNFAYGNMSSAGGEINAFDPTTGDFLAALDSNPAWQGLWALTFGNGAAGGDPNILYFTTGLSDETHGLFAALAVPEPSTLALLGAAMLGFFALRRRALHG
jgi:uncharacterized protein (TIGR03118 family)